MKFVYDNADLQRQLGAAKTFEELEAALQAITQLVPTFLAPDIFGRQAFCPELDAQISQLPARLGLEPLELGPPTNDNVCILATRVYPTGGHSRVAAEISQRIGAERTSLVFTDIYRQLRYRHLNNDDRARSPFRRRALVSLNAPTLTEKIIELHALLSALRPSRIFLLSNHMDVVAVAAAWAFRSVVDFIHHADHLPALGATLRFGRHVDLNFPIHEACRDAGLDPVYAAMGLGAGGGAEADRTPHPGLRIATCGGLVKYRQHGRYRWTDYAVAALARPDVDLVHIGPVDEAFQREVREALAAAGIDAARYVFAGVAPKLGEALAAHGADVFLSSYPTAGGKANLEAMAAGLPVIAAHDPDAPPLIPDRWPLPQFHAITSPEDLGALLADVGGLTASARSETARGAVVRQGLRFAAYVDGQELSPIDADAAVSGR